MVKSATAALTVAVLLLASACGVSSGKNEAALPDDPAELAQFLRGTTQYQYVPYPSPESLREAVDIAVVGRVIDVTAGKVWYPEENTGVTIVALEVEQTWKSHAVPARDVVYYMTRRPTNVDVEVYRRALPKRTRVVLFGASTKEAGQGDAPAPGYTLVEGAPDDVVYEPHPQGLLFEIGDALVNVWGEEGDPYPEWKGIDTIGELRGRLSLGSPAPVGATGSASLPEESTNPSG